MSKHQEFIKWLEQQIKNDQQRILVVDTDNTSGQYVAMRIRTIKILEHFTTCFKSELNEEINSDTTVQFNGIIPTEPKH